MIRFFATLLQRQIYFQVLIAIACGVMLGYFAPGTAVDMKVLGDAFIKLIKMLIAPIIFCTVVNGIAGVQDSATHPTKISRIGMKALVYFEIASTLALAIGWLIAHLLTPGAGMNIDPATLDSKSLTAYSTPNQSHDISSFFLNIIPATVFEAFSKGEILQVLLFSLLFGFSLHAMRDSAQDVVSFIAKISEALFGIVETIMKLAPLGAFGAMAFTIGKYGLASLLPLAKLMGCFYLTCLVFIFMILGLVAHVTGFSLLRFIGYIKEELLIVLGTSSSETVLPRIMRKLEDLGCPSSLVSLVIPTGYSFNLDGTAIYLTLAALFIAQATNTHLDLLQELTLLGILMLTSKGAAGVTGSGLITLTATLSTFPGIPVAGLALIVGIDRFMSEARALTNLIGNGVATLAIAAWEKSLDRQMLENKLSDKN